MLKFFCKCIYVVRVDRIEPFQVGRSDFLVVIPEFRLLLSGTEQGLIARTGFKIEVNKCRCRQRSDTPNYELVYSCHRWRRNTDS